jgi:hypothetical protein
VRWGSLQQVFFFSFFFFPQARASASPLLFIHTFGQDADGKKNFSMCRTQLTKKKRKKEKKKKVTMTIG